MNNTVKPLGVKEKRIKTDAHGQLIYEEYTIIDMDRKTYEADVVGLDHNFKEVDAKLLNPFSPSNQGLLDDEFIGEKPPQKRGGTLRFFLVIFFITIININVTKGDFHTAGHNNNRNQNDKPQVWHNEFLKKEPRLTLTLAEGVLAMTLFAVSFSSGLMNHILRPESGANLPTWTQGWFPSINFARMPWAKGLEKPVYYSAFLNVCINHPMVYTYQTLFAVSFSITLIDCTLR